MAQYWPTPAKFQKQELHPCQAAVRNAQPRIVVSLPPQGKRFIGSATPFGKELVTQFSPFSRGRSLNSYPGCVLHIVLCSKAHVNGAAKGNRCKSSLHFPRIPVTLKFYPTQHLRCTYVVADYTLRPPKGTRAYRGMETIKGQIRGAIIPRQGQNDGWTRVYSHFTCPSRMPITQRTTGEWLCTRISN